MSFGDLEHHNYTALDRHKKELASLKQSDPSFYSFLVENDKRLLDFGADEPEEGNHSKCRPLRSVGFVNFEFYSGFYHESKDKYNEKFVVSMFQGR